eukprot:821986-Prorocentrum_minimum.AAC.6
MLCPRSVSGSEQREHADSDEKYENSFKSFYEYAYTGFEYFSSPVGSDDIGAPDDSDSKQDEGFSRTDDDPSEEPAETRSTSTPPNVKPSRPSKSPHTEAPASVEDPNAEDDTIPHADTSPLGFLGDLLSLPRSPGEDDTPSESSPSPKTEPKKPSSLFAKAASTSPRFEKGAVEPWSFEEQWREESKRCMGAPYPLVFGDGGEIARQARA